MATAHSRFSIVDIDQLTTAAAETAVNAEVEVLENAGFIVREQKVIVLGPSHDPKQYVLLLAVTAAHLDHSDSAAHAVHLLSAQTFLEVPQAMVEQDGTYLAEFADGASTTPGIDVVDAESMGVRWNNHANPDPIAMSVMLPMNVNPAADVIIHYMCSKVGATIGDAVTWLTGAFFQTVGATHDADADAGGTSSAMTGDAATKTVQEETLTIANADVPAVPCKLFLTIQPTDGTLGTDDVVLHAVWLEYTALLLTS